MKLNFSQVEKSWPEAADFGLVAQPLIGNFRGTPLRFVKGGVFVITIPTGINKLNLRARP